MCLLAQQNVFLCGSRYLYLLFFTHMLLTHSLLIFYLSDILLPFMLSILPESKLFLKCCCTLMSRAVRSRCSAAPFHPVCLLSSIPPSALTHICSSSLSPPLLFSILLVCTLHGLVSPRWLRFAKGFLFLRSFPVLCVCSCALVATPLLTPPLLSYHQWQTVVVFL